jgi:N-acetylneuraminate lyase
MVAFTVPSTRLRGLFAAACTPLDSNGEVQLSQIPRTVEHLLAAGVDGLYICGSTGEGLSLTSQERRAVAAAYTETVAGRCPVIVQVGHNSLAEACLLAAHAQSINASGISATCPSYFPVRDEQLLIDCMHSIASAAPGLPFYYYHIPALTGSTLSMPRFLELAHEQIPTLRGLKYTDTKLHEFQTCLERFGGELDFLWGCDEMLMGAVATGGTAAIGSTYNVAARLNKEIMRLSQEGDFHAAAKLQYRSIQMIETLSRYPFHAALKALMAMLGCPQGGVRLPLRSLSQTDRQALQAELQAIGFFDWVGTQPTS